ncbi:ankyrin repeat protein, partial [Lepidopterella palustris CBS 459.81]
MVRLLIEARADLTCKLSTNGFTAIHVAASNGKDDVLRVLLDAGMDINARTSNGNSPLDSAINGGHLSTVMLLVESGANINHLNEFEETAVHLAAFAENRAILKYLLERGASPNARAKSGRYP